MSEEAAVIGKKCFTTGYNVPLDSAATLSSKGDTWTQVMPATGPGVTRTRISSAVLFHSEKKSN